jgi:hypothetical protein
MPRARRCTVAKTPGATGKPHVCAAPSPRLLRGDASLLGFIFVILTIVGGVAFLHPVTSLQRYQLPAFGVPAGARLSVGRNATAAAAEVGSATALPHPNRGPAGPSGVTLTPAADEEEKTRGGHRARPPTLPQLVRSSTDFRRGRGFRFHPVGRLLATQSMANTARLRTCVWSPKESHALRAGLDESARSAG